MEDRDADAGQSRRGLALLTGARCRGWSSKNRAERRHSENVATEVRVGLVQSHVADLVHDNTVRAIELGEAVVLISGPGGIEEVVPEGLRRVGDVIDLR